MATFRIHVTVRTLSNGMLHNILEGTTMPMYKSKSTCFLNTETASFQKDTNCIKRQGAQIA